MRRLPTLVAALLLHTAQHLLLATSVSLVTLLSFQALSRAKSTEDVAKIAEVVTVRIEGTTQGSGVLVKRDVNRYTVLTAWHVVRGLKLGDGLDIYTSDGKKHLLDQGSIKQLGETDMAVLSFSSSNAYAAPQIGDIKSISTGSSIYVAGFPLASSAVPIRLMRFLAGKVIANVSVSVPNGYQLLYSNQALPGMNGGPVLNDQGQLVGIHGQGETVTQASEQHGISVKTGTNLAVPISYYRQFGSGAAVLASSTQVVSADDYLVQAEVLLGQQGRSQDVIRLAKQALTLNQNANAYFYMGSAKSQLGDKKGAIADLGRAILINPQLAEAYVNRGTEKSALGDKHGAIADYTQAISINPNLVEAYSGRGNAKADLGDLRGAILDYNRALVVRPRFDAALNNRGVAKFLQGDKAGAIADYSQAIAINPRFAEAYSNRGDVKFDLGDGKGAIEDYIQAILINPQFAQAYAGRGAAKLGLGDFKGAIEDSSKAVSINPRLPVVYINRGSARYRLGDKQGACIDFRQSISLGDKTTVPWLQSDEGAWCRSVP
jgi:tetratricopeptide (TPR) repeat protein